jgi:hypothetical protein
VGIRPEFRWWVLTLVVVGVLLLISALALDRPNVVWDEGVPQCPHCRSEVAFFSGLCKTCGEPYDWTIARAETSPLSRWSLSSLEARYLRERVDALGPTLAVARVAAALEVPRASAEAYLESVDRGRCGWCGGTGRDLKEEGEGSICPVCFGSGQCIACGGDRRIQVGDEVAHQAYLVYRRGVEDLGAATVVPHGVRLKEVQQLTQELVRLHAGTLDVTQVLFWPDWPTSRTAVDVSRERLDLVLQTLAKE